MGIDCRLQLLDDDDAASVPKDTIRTMLADLSILAAQALAACGSAN